MISDDAEYIVSTRDGMAFIEHRAEVIVSAEDYAELIDRLKSGMKRVVQAGFILDTRPLIESGTWVVPQSRKDIWASGGCVYFAKCHELPNLIRIGATTNLSSAIKSLYYEYGYEFIVVAFVKTLEYKRLKKGLHLLFDEYTSPPNEWFESEPVMKFVNECLEGLQS